MTQPFPFSSCNKKHLFCFNKTNPYMEWISVYLQRTWFCTNNLCQQAINNCSIYTNKMLHTCPQTSNHLFTSTLNSKIKSFSHFLLNKPPILISSSMTLVRCKCKIQHPIINLVYKNMVLRCLLLKPNWLMSHTGIWIQIYWIKECSSRFSCKIYIIRHLNLFSSLWYRKWTANSTNSLLYFREW